MYDKGSLKRELKNAKAQLAKGAKLITVLAFHHIHYKNFGSISYAITAPARARVLRSVQSRRLAPRMLHAPMRTLANTPGPRRNADV